MVRCGHGIQAAPGRSKGSVSVAGAVPRHQGGASGTLAVLPDGRLLRTVLRRRRRRVRRARYRPHQARQAPGRRHSDVRRAGALLRVLPAAPDPQGLQGRHLRADGGSRGSQEARIEVGRVARRRPSGDARHADRGHAARRAGPQLPRGARIRGWRPRSGLARRLDGRLFADGADRAKPRRRARASVARRVVGAGLARAAAGVVRAAR